MPVQYHPKVGTVVICDFQRGFVPPEMVKRRPAVVVSPPIASRKGLCTVVPLSTGIPHEKMAYHVELPDLKLPNPWDKGANWVKADMIYALSLSRIDLIRRGRAENSRRVYYTDPLPYRDMLAIRKAMLCSLGMTALTKLMT
jgi:uncharacterized protein YifN (PemK superfamily)